MANIGERRSTALNSTAGEKPVIVRVKRRPWHSPLDGLWLEINERPKKRPILEFQKLSLVDDDGDADESAHGHGIEHSTLKELKTKKVFVWHFKTVGSSKAAIHVVESFVSNSVDAVKDKPGIEERKQTFSRDNKLQQLLSKGKKYQDVFSQNACFEQIWNCRRGNKKALHNKLHGMCHFYDVVRVDADEGSSNVKEQGTASLEDQRIFNSYLPLPREIIPSAIAEIESDIGAYLSKQGCEFTPSTVAEIESDMQVHLSEQDDYVYDYYTVEDGMDIDDEDAISSFPLVQVEDEDFYEGPDEKSEYDSDDSNAEAHPRNDYPDEESEEDGKMETEISTCASEEEEEAESDSLSSIYSEFEDLSQDVAHHMTYEDGDHNVDYEDDYNYGYDLCSTEM